VASESVYRARSRKDLAAVQDAFRYHVFSSGIQRNVQTIDDEGIATLHYDHVLVELMRMRGGRRCLTARPKRHLAPVRPIENVSFDSRCCIVRGRDPVCRVLHEHREIIHDGDSSTRLMPRLAWSATMSVPCPLLAVYFCPLNRVTLNCAPANRISPEIYAQNSNPTET